VFIFIIIVNSRLTLSWWFLVVFIIVTMLLPKSLFQICFAIGLFSTYFNMVLIHAPNFVLCALKLSGIIIATMLLLC
jgi:hypothetical protein